MLSPSDCPFWPRICDWGIEVEQEVRRSQSKKKLLSDHLSKLGQTVWKGEDEGEDTGKGKGGGK